MTEHKGAEKFLINWKKFEEPSSGEEFNSLLNGSSVSLRPSWFKILSNCFIPFLNTTLLGRARINQLPIYSKERSVRSISVRTNDQVRVSNALMIRK